MTTRWQKITWILLIIVAVFLLSCTDILLEKGGSIQVSLSLADAPGGRNALAKDGGTQYKVKGWVVDTQGEVIEEVEDYLVDGRGNISFTSVEIHMNVRVLIQVYDTNDAILYSGVSDFFVVVPEGNVVPVELQRGDFRKWFGPVGTVEVNFSVEWTDWENLINFPDNDDLFIATYIMSSDYVVQGESLVAGDFGDHTVTFSNIPAETGTIVSVVVFYNPKQKYTYEEDNLSQMIQYALHMDISDSFDVNEGHNTVEVSLTPYEYGGVFQNGYSYFCSSQEEIEELIALANPSVSISLEKDVVITNTITIEKDISFYLPGDIYVSSLYPSLSRGDSVNGPMFEVTSGGSLSLGGIILDGQANTEGCDYPLIINHGSTGLNSVIIQNNVTTITTDGYNSGAIYSTGNLVISYSTIQNITVNNSTGNADLEIANVVVASGTVEISESTIETPLNSNGGKYYSLMLGLNDEAFENIEYNINYSAEGGGSSLQRLFDEDITYTNPPNPYL